MRRSFVDTRLGQVHCVRAGEAPGTRLLLLHQTPRSVDEFAEVMPRLARERRVLAVDTPGYGCSDPVEGRPSIGDYALAMFEVLDAFGIDTVIPVGHHTGALVAIEMAALAPERVEQVVLSGPVYTDAAGRAELAKFFVQWRIAPDGSHLLEKWRKYHEWLPDPALVQRFALDLFRAGETSEQGHFAVAEYRMEERLRHLRCPALFLYGARDPFTAPDRVAPLRAAFPEVVEKTIDAGIFSANEAPAAFAGAVLEFLGRGGRPA